MLCKLVLNRFVQAGVRGGRVKTVGNIVLKQESATAAQDGSVSFIRMVKLYSLPLNYTMWLSHLD